MQDSRLVRFGVFELDLHTRELRKYGVRVRLTGQPYQVLVALLEQRGEVVTREGLCEALWPGQPRRDHDRNLNKIISQVREALGDSAGAPRYLQTVPRVGYRFLLPVSTDTEAAMPATPLPEARSHLRLIALGLFFAAIAAAALVWKVG